MQQISDILGQAFNQLVAEAGRDNPIDPDSDDYIGADGLLMCGKCHTPKQCEVPFNVTGEPKIIRLLCACRCVKEAYEQEKQDRKRDEEMRVMDQLRKASMMTGKMRACTFDRFEHRPENKKLFDLLYRYVDRFDEMYANNQGLLLWGAVGSGKTYAAACIANELLARRTSVIATSMIQLMRDNPFGDKENEFLESANRARLMIIDDLGAERSTEFAIERVYGVIDSRSRSGKPLIVTTNLTLKDMQYADDIRYQRIYSRILETCYPVEVKGISWRSESAADRYDAMRKLLRD